MRKKLVYGWKRSPSCKPFIDCDIPLVRGDCIDIPLVRGDSGSGIWLPLVRGWDCVGIPQVWGDWFVWLSAYPSKCRGDLFCALPLVRGCIGWERSCVLPIVFAPNPQWRFPVGKSCMDEWMEILLCEGGDVELCARTSKHILAFAIDLLSLTLSYICALHHIAISYTYLVWLCAIFVLNQASFI